MQLFSGGQWTTVPGVSILAAVTAAVVAAGLERRHFEPVASSPESIAAEPTAATLAFSVHD